MPVASPESSALQPSSTDAARCPLCGGDNACAQCTPGAVDGAACWCMSVQVSRAALARIPDAQRGKACICAACAGGA
ncbi:DNA or RNA helicase of superfamily II [Xylophilus rhododendri]|uniref:DNA or RNA helicase of superfamily II n=1 Tax=Xylophilus rhododendri TaxID=2697032 RepID=A0A857J6M6_9BURK|nr:cysteine-rich CWC family protein [Xylophilus rhododendri]QHI98681.1 DNA or RNA helicase of superfamily II [Xylophilus rhododendri]